MSSSGDILEEEHEGSVVDALSLLDDSPAGPSFGVGTPNDEESEFGTHEPDFGVSDDDEGLPIPPSAAGGGDLYEFGDEDPDFGDEIPGVNEIYGNEGENDEEEGLPISPSAAGGGDLYEFGDESPDFGDEIPGVNEIYGDSPNGGFEHPPADVAFDLALLASQEPSEDDETAAAEAVAGDAADADYTIGAPLVPSRAYELERIAADHAAVATRKEKLEKTRDWDLSFGPIWAPAGRETTITVSPQCLFRGEKIIATDTGSPNGRGTRIMQVAIGNKIQRPAGRNGSLTVFFANNALGNGIKFDTAQQWSDIAVTVSFIQECTFDMTVLGRAVID